MLWLVCVCCVGREGGTERGVLTIGHLPLVDSGDGTGLYCHLEGGGERGGEGRMEHMSESVLE